VSVRGGGLVRVERACVRAGLGACGRVEARGFSGWVFARVPCFWGWRLAWAGGVPCGGGYGLGAGCFSGGSRSAAGGYVGAPTLVGNLGG
jgi:hypothetical protein